MLFGPLDQANSYLKFTSITLCKINSDSFVTLKQYFARTLHYSEFFNGGSSKAGLKYKTGE
jgi:hypothetical protein